MSRMSSPEPMMTFRRLQWSIVLFCVVLIAAAGPKKQISLTAQEEDVACRAGLDRQVLMAVKEVTGEHIHRLTGYDENGYRIMAEGICVTVPEDKAEGLLSALRLKMKPLKHMAFIIEMNEGIKRDTIGILKGADQYDILRVMQTNGDNYDITNTDVIETLKEWEKTAPFEIMGAESDWVELEFISLPKDLKHFVNGVKDFCPDAVDPGARGVDDLADEIQKTKRLFLWWE